jgi:hypothetical protein
MESSCLSELELSLWDVPLEDSKLPASHEKSLELEVSNDEEKDLSLSVGGYWPVRDAPRAISPTSAPSLQFLEA